MLEFQSSVDWFMTLRVQGYAVRLYESLCQGRRPGRGDRLPAVLAVVVYNGTARGGGDGAGRVGGGGHAATGGDGVCGAAVHGRELRAGGCAGVPGREAAGG